jgi:hypothetical protein
LGKGIDVVSVGDDPGHDHAVALEAANHIVDGPVAHVPSASDLLSGPVDEVVVDAGGSARRDLHLRVPDVSPGEGSDQGESASLR